MKVASPPFELFALAFWAVRHYLDWSCWNFLGSTMTTPIRKKRNFKALQLDVTQSAKPKEPELIPTRAAPATTGAVKGKKRPPPMTLNAPKLGQTPVTSDADGNLLAAGVGPPSAPAASATSARRNTYHTTLSNTLANLDMNAETRYDLRNEDLKDLQELGQGNGGSVKKVEHVPTKTIMAKKVSYSRSPTRIY